MDSNRDIDADYAAFQALVVRRDQALDACDAEQKAGRTGLVPYSEAKALQVEVQAAAAKLAAAIEEERASL